MSKLLSDTDIAGLAPAELVELRTPLPTNSVERRVLSDAADGGAGQN